MTTSSLSAEEQIRHNEEEHEYTGVWFDWERLGENFDDNKLTLTVTAGEATVVYTRIQGEWNRMCDLTDFGNSLRDRLKDNGWSTEFAGYYEPFNDDALTGFYTDAMGKLAAVWPEKRWLESDGVSEDDLWRGDNYDDRLALALADGSAINQNGEPVTEANQYVWQMSDWGDRYVDNNGELRIGTQDDPTGTARTRTCSTTGITAELRLMRRMT